MRAPARMSTVALLFTVALGLAGCRQFEREMDIHFGWMHQAQAPVGAERPIHRKVRAKRPAVHPVAQPERVTPGAKLREYCGRRHILFQKGTLHENETEKMRNNNLCYQLYKA